ncbi:hypothetical protein M440DRAFT_1142935 [Trichoderma longibrachiatum ATCC 18648]|uniref:Uncharacterized protein n=1 Tax=Trichoderma longibrachiatum ATCC 18648 TaxID=983965 RepID=A0A2T4BQJ4_TRILO|nr:hypothetical protein M440DRAFT_1142935 [Trichoderma longibrachiatum ATCC 18648]
MGVRQRAACLQGQYWMMSGQLEFLFLLSCLRCYCFSLLCPWPFTLSSQLSFSHDAWIDISFSSVQSPLSFFLLIPSFLS